MRLPSIAPLLLAGLLAWSAAVVAQTKIPVPSDINMHRMKLLNRPDGDSNEKSRMKVYGSLRMPPEGTVKSETFIKKVLETYTTPELLSERLTNAIAETSRFQVYVDHHTQVRDQSSIFVEATITDATQNLMDFAKFKRAATVVRLNVMVTDSDTGEIAKAIEITGEYGPVDGADEGTVINPNGSQSEQEINDSLYRDYERALTDAIEQIKDYLMSKYRPIGKVLAVSDEQVVIDGGSDNGFRAEDEITVFRASFITTGTGREVLGLTTGLAVARCPSVQEETSNCELVLKREGAAIKEGDYAVLKGQ